METVSAVLPLMLPLSSLGLMIASRQLLDCIATYKISSSTRPRLPLTFQKRQLKSIFPVGTFLYIERMRGTPYGQNHAGCWQCIVGGKIQTRH
jgi:hypothetical protein